MGGVGVMRFSAAANHSSLKESTFDPRGAEMRSIQCQKGQKAMAEPLEMQHTSVF